MLKEDKQIEINLGLWKHFNDEADKTKDRMWTIASWMFTLQGGLIAYISKCITYNNRHLTINNPPIVIITSLIGIVVCSFTMFMIQQYGYHINSMWNRANIIRREIPGLDEIWFVNNGKKIEEDKKNVGKEEKGLPPVSFRLIILSIFFMIVFILMLIKSLF
jgi:xanthosine utilization system XapX-like protein